MGLLGGVVIGVLLTWMVLVTFLSGVTYLRGYRRLKRTDPTPIEAIDASTDEVECVGTARPVGETVTAPFGTDTLVHESEREDYRYDSDDDDYEWRTMREITDRVPFVVDDGTGEILVDPEDAEVAFESETYETDRENPAPPAFREFLEEYGATPIDVDESGTVKRRRITEARLDPGEEVYVYGPVQAGPPEDAPEDAPGEVLEPYIGVEELVESVREWLPVVGDPDKFKSMAGGTPAFVISDGGETPAQRRLLKRGGAVLGLGFVFLTFDAVLVYSLLP